MSKEKLILPDGEGSMKKSRIFFIAGALACFLFGMTPALPAKGKIELGFHYGHWSVNMFKGLIESALDDALRTEFKDQFMKQILEDHPDFVETSYDQKVRFDSGGGHFGFELRWYPGGENGSFSLGFGVEKTSMKISLPEVSATLRVEELNTHKAASFAAAVNGEFLMKPLSFHLSFRWDIIPSARFHPYLTFGLGIAGGSALEEGRLTYGYTADLVGLDLNEHYEDSATKTIKELKDEIDKKPGEAKKFPLPGFVPFVQLHLGLKLKITSNVHALIDYGVFDGFLLRGSIAYRF